LAAAVPANNYTLAQEILRGVAQAQHEFNDNGLNGRLLESGICLQDVQLNKNKSSDFL
jgi:ABC-type branched-subunit amino acid transport system substrate-binding protein